MNQNVDLARFLFGFLLWLIGFSSQYFGATDSISPRWLAILFGVLRKNKRVSRDGAIWQLWGYEVIILLNPVILPIDGLITGGLFLLIAYVVNLAILAVLLRTA